MQLPSLGPSPIEALSAQVFFFFFFRSLLTHVCSLTGLEFMAAFPDIRASIIIADRSC